MKISILVILTLFSFLGRLNAQVLVRESNDKSLILGFLPKTVKDKTTAKTFQVSADLTKERAVPDTAKVPYQYGKPISAVISISDGDYWTEGESAYSMLQIHAKEATSLSLNFGKFKLSEKAELYIYNQSQQMIVGPITSKENNSTGKYAIAPLSGSSLILLLKEPAEQNKKIVSEIVTSEAIIGYKEIYRASQGKGIGDSGSCMYDATCSGRDGSPVSRYFTDGSQCTGALVNNETRDGRPFFLTAFHCIDSNDDGSLSLAEVNATNNYVFQFFYRSQTCNSSVVASYWQFYGATWRSAFESTDFSLLELYNAIPIESNIKFYGWHRSNNAPSEGYTIHHPRGDLQKYSHTQHIQTSTFSSNMWGVEWNLGVTEPGSSGGPLLNTNDQVIGQLRGGSSSCSSPTLNDRYGKFGKSWNSHPSAGFQLKYWLSPTQDLFEIGGLDRGYITGPLKVCYGQNAVYTMPNLPAGYAISWSASPQLNIVSATPGSVTISPVSASSSENGYVRASLNGIVFREFKILVGVPQPATNIIMFSSSCLGGSDWEASFEPSPLIPGAKYVWIKDGYEYPPTDIPTFSIYEFPANPITLNLRIQTDCGVSAKVYATDAMYYPACPSTWLIAPNPSSSEFEVSKNYENTAKTLNSKQRFNIKLIDSRGKTLRTSSSNSGKAKINVTTLPTGNYFLLIDDGKEIIKRNVIVSH
jgi:V8-like Glu-specific endopeptidase